MNNADTKLHVRGISTYIDDRDFPTRGLHCEVYCSPVAKGRILSLDVQSARDLPGVAFVLTAEDVPGENQIGGIIQDEPLLADGEVDFVGMPVAAVYAWDEQIARDAVALICAEYEEHEPVLDPRVAYKNNDLISPQRSFVLGDADAAIASAAFVANGSCESGAQEHFYLEGQACIATPTEGGGVFLSSSTQGPTAVQRCVSRVSGLPMHQIEVDVRRLGGGFGGKEDQANTWASFAALGALRGAVPCRMVLRRAQDMLATGKRHPYSSDFTLALDENGKFLAFKAMYYQNAGAAADLSPSIMERTLFHATASYFVPNVHATAASCRTNIAPNTAFRGFGGPQAMFVFEAAIREASKVSGIPVRRLQEINLLESGDPLPYGQSAEDAKARVCWKRAFELYGLEERMARIDAEAADPIPKRFTRGYAVMPVCFGISFTTTFMNQARALIHVYTDGSVGVSTGAVEMGQGVNQKIRDIVAATIGLPLNLIKMETTNTTRVSNTSPTAASSGSDLNGAAAEMACQMIISRILQMKADELGCEPEELCMEQGRLYRRRPDPSSKSTPNPGNTPADSGSEALSSWPELVLQAYQSRVHLSAEAHYSTPDLHFDKQTEKGRPFAYHSYGSAYIEATVDRLLGSYSIDKAYMVHDLGRSINPLVDLGQIEGGLAQGIGWMTVEEMRYREDGKPLTATAGTYKLPDILSSPQDIQVEFLENADNPRAVRGSKAVGEPPFMYGIGAYHAIRMAAGLNDREYVAPMTPEQVFTQMRNQKKSGA